MYNIIQETLEAELKDFNLSFYAEPIYDIKEFWNLVKKFPKQITQLTFDLIYPNMASSKFVNSLVQYSADGGGNIFMKVGGKRKLLHTAKISGRI